MNPITEAAPSTTRPHRWNISDTSCEGFYAGTPARVWRARCMNEGCNAKTVFPCHPEEFKGVKPVPVPPCTGVETPKQACVCATEPVAGPLPAEVADSPETPVTAPESSENAKATTHHSDTTVIEHSGEPTEMIEKEKTMPAGGNTAERTKYYWENRQEIAADVRRLGKKEAMKKWGIPESTFRGWEKHPLWMPLLGDESRTEVEIRFPPESNGMPFSISITIATLTQLAEGYEQKAREFRDIARELSAVETEE